MLQCRGKVLAEEKLLGLLHLVCQYERESSTMAVEISWESHMTIFHRSICGLYYTVIMIMSLP